MQVIVMLNVTYKPFMLSVIMLNVVMLNVVKAEHRGARDSTLLTK
jgi:hypothetical protein